MAPSKPSTTAQRVPTAFRPCQSRRQVSQHRRTHVCRLFGGDKKEGGGFGGMGNLMENMKKAQSMVQTEAKRVQDELAQTNFEGYDDEETIKVVFKGNQEPVSVELTEDAVGAGLEELEKRVTEAMKDAHGKSVEGMQEKMKEMSKRLGLPEGMKMPGL